MSIHRQILDGMEVFRFDNLDRIGLVRHAVSTRRRWTNGVVGEANLSMHGGREFEHGLANRRALCRALALDEDRLTWGRQAHENRVCVIGPKGLPPTPGVPATDGLVTDVPGVPLLGLSADCPLIALVDPAKPAVGVVHASWRCTVERIVQLAVAKMREAFGSRPESMLAAIGPSAGPDRYEVGPDVIEVVQRAFGNNDCIIRRHGRMFMDLWAANRQQLLESGLQDANVAIAGLCTITEVDTFYSYRREGAGCGRFGLMIGLAGY